MNKDKGYFLSGLSCEDREFCKGTGFCWRASIIDEQLDQTRKNSLNNLEGSVNNARCDHESVINLIEQARPYLSKYYI